MKSIAGACGLFVALTAAPVAIRAQAPSPNPYEIFGKAQQVWQGQRYPALVTYIVHIHTARGSRQDERHYSSQWSSSSDGIAVNPISTEEERHPYKPPAGFDLNLFGFHAGHVGGPNEGTGTNGDLIGVPEIAPNYSFGISKYEPPLPPTQADIVEEIRKEYHDPAPDKVARIAAKDGLKTIASVTASSAIYKIRLAGIESAGGHSDYHLTLVPLRDPAKYRLRDVWINEDTYATDQIRTYGNFIDRGTSGVPWLVTFKQIRGAEYIERESTERGIAHWFDSISVTFEDFGFSSGRLNGAFMPDSTIREP